MSTKTESPFPAETSVDSPLPPQCSATTSTTGHTGHEATYIPGTFPKEEKKLIITIINYYYY